MKRKEAICKAREKVGDKKLFWFGVRSTDAVSLNDYDVDTTYLSLTSPLLNQSVDEYCLETHKKKRVDLDDYLIDYDETQEAKILLEKIENQVAKDFFLMPYSSNKLVYKAVKIAGGEFLGILPEMAHSLNNKFFVNLSLSALDVPTVPWLRFSGVADEAFCSFVKHNREFVVRGDYSGGGRNVWRFSSLCDFQNFLKEKPDVFATSSFAPYLAKALPLNLDACIMRDGRCLVYPPRVQLIGCKEATNRIFGYCGNDFSISNFLNAGELLACKAMVEKTAQWLFKNGYVGAFGLDALLHDGKPIFIELNPRLQGSTELAVSIQKERDCVDILTANFMAWLGIDFQFREEAYLEWALSQPKCAQVYIHNCSTDDVFVRCPERQLESVNMLPQSSVAVDSNAVAMRLVTSGAATTDGFTLLPEVSNRVNNLAQMQHAYNAHQQTSI